MKSDKVKLNLNAESAAFSGRIPDPALQKDIIKATADIKIPALSADFSRFESVSPIQLDKSVMGHNLNSLNMTAFKQENISASSLNIPTLESSPMPIVSDSVNPIAPLMSNSALAGQEMIRGIDSQPNILASSQLINASLNINPPQNDNISSAVSKVLNKEIKPALENLGQYINQMANTNQYNANQSDELPTIPPSNLVFFDRINKASQPPDWS